jgi:hypothetical protein
MLLVEKSKLKCVLVRTLVVMALYLEPQLFMKPLAEGIMGEANMDGSIYMSDLLDPNSPEFRQTLNHEMRHATDMRIGKLAYADDSITYNGEVFPRETRRGKDMINVDGEWKEAGHTGFPWEDDANNGNN